MSPDACPGAVAESIRRAAADRRDLVVSLRRRLHQIPELAHGEIETTRLLAEFCAERGIPFEVFDLGTGGLSVLGPEDAPAVILRADLDALPVDEALDLPFRSQTPGRMHACGHDAHAAMLLAALDALWTGAAPMPEGLQVACVFQPAEEGPGGLLQLLEGGLLAKVPACGAVALHVWPELPAGAVGIAAGPVMASMDGLRIRFVGRGGHGAYPHACVDPVVMTAEAILGLQTIVSRRINPLDSGLITIGSIHGGTAGNVIPDWVEVHGTVRAYAESVRAEILSGVERVARGVAEAHGGRCEIVRELGYPVTKNDPAVTDALREILRKVLGPEAVLAGRQTMGAEDMGFLLERVPGCYLQLGSSRRPEAAEPLHSARFLLDEGCLTVGVKALLSSLWAFVPR